MPLIRVAAVSGWDSEYILKIKPTGFLDERAYDVWKRRVEYNQGFCPKQPEDRDAVKWEGKDYRKVGGEIKQESVLNISLRNYI